MKLFLASSGLPESLRPALQELLGSTLSGVRVAHVPNAADPYPEAQRRFLERSRNELVAAGMTVTDIDLRDFDRNPIGLQNALSCFDIVWLAGGNTYYLRYWLNRCGFDHIVSDLFAQSLVCAGGSAGAIVLGSDLRFYDVVDDPAMAPQPRYEGLCLYRFQLLPHWGDEYFQPMLDRVRASYEGLGAEIVPITDQQAVCVRDGAYTIVGP